MENNTLYVEPHLLQMLNNNSNSLASTTKKTILTPQNISDQNVRRNFSSNYTECQQTPFNVADMSNDGHSIRMISPSFATSNLQKHKNRLEKNDHTLERQLGSAEHSIFRAPNPNLVPTKTKKTSSYQLPGYIKPFSSQIDRDELELLKKKGVFDIPSGFLQYEILQCFIQFAYWDSPAMSLTSFIKSISSESGKNGRVSLLLFHAVMFVGLKYLPNECLAFAGYNDRRAIEDQFFSKARILYDLGSERDTLEIIQALLLLVQGLSRNEELKDRWHWLGISISLAYSIGLHRIQSEQRKDSHEIRLKKRIWWCCVVQDRLLALTEGRPTRIRLEESSTPPLLIDHFDFDSTLEGSRRKLAFDNMNNFLQKIELTLQMSESFMKNLSESRIAVSHRAVGVHKWQKPTSVNNSKVATDFESRVFGHLINAGYLSRNS